MYSGTRSAVAMCTASHASILAQLSLSLRVLSLHVGERFEPTDGWMEE